MTEGTDWVEEARRLVTGLGQSLGDAARGGTSAHPADCRWCPVCQAAALVRGERPEVTDALADVLSAAAAALRGVSERAAAPARPAAEEEPSAPVQHIEIA